MSAFNLSLTFENIKTITVMFLDIFIIWLIIYYALKIVRNNRRTIQIFKGILFVVVIDGIAKFFGLKTLQFLADMFINWGFLVIIIIFQPEIRSLLERMGKSNMFSRITTLTGDEKENLVDQIVTAVMLLSKNMTGALISIEQVHSLEDFIQTGTRMNSDVTAELLTSIFVTTTPLHDGAVIIQGDKIACASAYFPPTNMELPSRYGSRHRAAIGISEITDAVTIIVSEETGTVSVCQSGQIFQVDRKQLREYLMRVICGEATEVHGSTKIESSEYVIDDEKAAQRRKSGVLSKLAIKKQNDAVSEKIRAEEVIPAENSEVKEAPQNEPADLQRKQREADEEAAAADIKLPHRKEKTQQSYPQKPEKTQKPKPAAASPKRMTPEEVRAAREASRQQYSRVVRDSDDEKFDTSMIDISKIVGFKGELSKTFEMVDQLPDDRPKTNSDRQEGGEHRG